MGQRENGSTDPIGFVGDSCTLPEPLQEEQRSTESGPGWNGAQPDSMETFAHLIDKGGRNLIGDEFEVTREQQVAGVNELIMSREIDKVDSLLNLLDVEGLFIWGVGQQPPAVLTLVSCSHFPGMVRVYAKLIDKGADITKKFEGRSAKSVAAQRDSPVLYM